MSQEWLNNLVVGDVVFVESSCTEVPQPLKVIRTTKTLIILCNDQKFRRCGGGRQGTVHYGSIIVSPTPEGWVRVYRYRGLCRLKGFEWGELSSEQLGSVLDLLGTMTA